MVCLQTQKKLAKQFSIENDSENTYKYFSVLIKNGQCNIPIEYAVQLYKHKYYKQALKYFYLISLTNHPIAHYYIAIMKYYGNGCDKDKDESYKIL